MVDILMAVFNGENFLAQQLESLMSQDFDGFRLIACDDGSSDGSRDILEAFGARFPDRIKTVYNDKNVGVRENFFALMALSDAEYIMFCDQDDVWDSGKVQSSSMSHIRYAGKPLHSRDIVTWSVQLWDENGEPEEPVSDPNYTSILEEDDENDPYDRSYGLQTEEPEEDAAEDPE